MYSIHVLHGICSRSSRVFYGAILQWNGAVCLKVAKKTQSLTVFLKCKMESLALVFFFNQAQRQCSAVFTVHHPSSKISTQLELLQTELSKF